MIAFATFPGDYHYHLLERASRTRTLCGLSTKGSKRDVRELRPSAVVVFTAPTPDYTPCPLCVAQVGQKP